MGTGTTRTVADFAQDARQLSLGAFRQRYGDVFLVALHPAAGAEQDKGFVAATRVATHLDELENELEEYRRGADGPAAPDGGHPVYVPRWSSAESNLLSIGALEHNDIVVDHDSISSDHAALILRDGGFFLQDSGSTNGTSVGGEKVDPGTAPAPLCNGDELQLGLFKLRFLTADAFKRLASRTGQ